MPQEQEKVLQPEKILNQQSSENITIEKPSSESDWNFELPGKNQAEQQTEEGKTTTERVVVAAPVIPATGKDVDIREKEIENIMSKGLEELYTSLSPAKQQEFRVVGEQTAKQVNQLLSEAKVKVNKIIDLIKNWLKLIPGVNKFFLEQETKIKVDEIIQLQEKGGEK